MPLSVAEHSITANTNNPAFTQLVGGSLRRLGEANGASYFIGSYESIGAPRVAKHEYGGARSPKGSSVLPKQPEIVLGAACSTTAASRIE